MVPVAAASLEQQDLEVVGEGGGEGAAGGSAADDDVVVVGGGREVGGIEQELVVVGTCKREDERLAYLYIWDLDRNSCRERERGGIEEEGRIRLRADREGCGRRRRWRKRKKRCNGGLSFGMLAVGKMEV